MFRGNVEEAETYYLDDEPPLIQTRFRLWLKETSVAIKWLFLFLRAALEIGQVGVPFEKTAGPLVRSGSKYSTRLAPHKLEGDTCYSSALFLSHVALPFLF